MPSVITSSKNQPKPIEETPQMTPRRYENLIALCISISVNGSIRSDDDDDSVDWVTVVGSVSGDFCFILNLTEFSQISGK
mmetsp:Transcript_30221/g.69276  ORF Transcript_30221/g.69276 Transcript_30221/m.69276 type:complete len:80 (-) Transcript_30221:264-503(-)